MIEICIYIVAKYKCKPASQFACSPSGHPSPLTCLTIWLRAAAAEPLPNSSIGLSSLTGTSGKAERREAACWDHQATCWKHQGYSPI